MYKQLYLAPTRNVHVSPFNDPIKIWPTGLQLYYPTVARPLTNSLIIVFFNNIISISYIQINLMEKVYMGITLIISK